MMNFIGFKDESGAIKAFIRVEHITVVHPLPENARGPNYTRIYCTNGQVDVNETIDTVIDMISKSK